MHEDSSTPSPRKPLSGFQRRKLRVAQGLPRYTPAELLRRKETDPPRRLRQWHAQVARIDEVIDAVKLARGCADCGYKTNVAALEFDHLPGFDKVADIAVLRTHGKLPEILVEIEKCEVVCANCHRIRTENRR